MENASVKVFIKCQIIFKYIWLPDLKKSWANLKQVDAFISVLTEDSNSPSLKGKDKLFYYKFCKYILA